MKLNKGMLRNAHFLGTKIRNLRKRNNLTMEDLSARCVKIDVESAPSVSYLSMIERGKRVPSQEMLTVVANVFQKEVSWFLDDVPEVDAIVPSKGNRGGIKGVALEPSILFSNEILQIAIPEMLSQTGVSGRQFAHLLIRAYQENHQNHFPDLERAAEEVGKKRMGMRAEDLMDICKQLGLKIKWFEETSPAEANNTDKILRRSYFESPNIIFINKILKRQPTRLKYDLAVYIGHWVLHNGDGIKSTMRAGRQRQDVFREEEIGKNHSSAIDAQDIMHAWRDFECSFFAGALLCPKVPFRRLLDQQGYEISSVAKIVDVTPTIVMRRMTAVSSYPHWHYFDAYPPGKLNAVYRGNGIPLPWGNMRMVYDPCQHWAVFRMIHSNETGSSAQISLLDVGDETHIYGCESLKVEDLAGNSHVLCTGIDINPAIEAQGKDPLLIAEQLKRYCVDNGGSVSIAGDIKKDLMSVAQILNISWLERGIEKPARLICPRSSACPREPKCQLD